MAVQSKAKTETTLSVIAGGQNADKMITELTLQKMILQVQRRKILGQSKALLNEIKEKDQEIENLAKQSFPELADKLTSDDEPDDEGQLYIGDNVEAE